MRIATTDPIKKIISIASNIEPPMLDQVLLHEVMHAITMSYGLLKSLQGIIDIYDADEWIAQITEKHALEAIKLTSDALGRPVCINGTCVERIQYGI